MNLPAYLVTEIVNRLERDMPEDELRTVLKPLKLDLDVEPGPPAPMDELTAQFDDDCDSGTIMLEGTLELFGQRTPLHFRLSYAGYLTSDDPLDRFFGVTTAFDILTWDGSEPPVPFWYRIGTSILNKGMLQELQKRVMQHAEDHADPIWFGEGLEDPED